MRYLRPWAFWLIFATFTIGTIATVHAVVSTTAPRNDYTGNGSTATYSYTFRIFAATDLKVTKRDHTTNVETLLTYTTDYTVTGVNRASGGTITLTAGNLTSGDLLTIRFSRTPRQSTDLRNQGSFFPETHEDKFDELTKYAQQNRDEIDRSLKLPETEAGSSAATTLPVAANRASKFFYFDSSGNPSVSAATSGNISSYMATVLDDTSASAARTTLGAVGLTGNETVAGVKTFSSNPKDTNADTIYAVATGSWTPSVGGNATYTTQQGNYWKIGPLYFIRCILQINVLGTGSASTISGLPTTVLGNDHGLSFGTYSSVATNVTSLYGRFNAAGSTISLFGPTAAGANNTATSTIMGNGTALTITGWYIGAP